MAICTDCKKEGAPYKGFSQCQKCVEAEVKSIIEVYSELQPDSWALKTFEEMYGSQDHLL